MRHIEREEEIMLNSNPKKQAIHLCIVNLVIGTLYCSKGNNEFGISRVIKSLDPIGKKLSPETWYYAKRCFVSLYDILAKHMLLLKDSCFSDILSFFDLCEANGKHISASFVGSNVSAEFTTNEDKFTNNVSSEARRLKAMYLRLYQ